MESDTQILNQTFAQKTSTIPYQKYNKEDLI